MGAASCPPAGGGFGYVLWWGFSGQPLGRLLRGMGCLARHFNSPAFAPHVTIATQFAEPPFELAGELARRLPLVLRLSRVASYDEYFRRLVLEGPTAPRLLEARQLVVERSGGAAQVPESPPHLSLLYSDAKQTALQPVRELLEARLPLRLELTTLMLMHCPSAEPRSWSALGRYGSA